MRENTKPTQTRQEDWNILDKKQGGIFLAYES